MRVYLTPENGAVVRGVIKIGGRVIVGRVRGVAGDGVDIETTDAPPSGRGAVRCAGRPGAPVVAWSAELERLEGVVRVAWPDTGAAGVWPVLRALMGLAADADLPPSPRERSGDSDELSSNVPSEAGSMAPRDNETPSMAPGSSPVATLETLKGARAGTYPCVRTPVLHMPSRTLAAALLRSPGLLSPMIEIEGVPDLRPRDIVVARIALDDVTLFLEGTVVTARRDRARLRLTIPTEGARAALEQAP